MQPNDFIKVIRESDAYITDIYLSGGCYQFHKILKMVFKDAKPYINSTKDHVVSEINGVFYDITGIAAPEEFSPLKSSDVEMCEKWSFSKKYWLYRECPNCEEPVFALSEQHSY